MEQTKNLGREETAAEVYHIRVQRRLAALGDYTRWVAGTFDGYYGDRILDVGSSTGNLAAEIISKRRPEIFTSIDVSDAVLAELRGRIAYPGFSAERMDVQDEGVLRLKGNRYDTITCFNVLEHVRDDLKALKNMNLLLEEGGRLLLYVPAIPWLYGQVDESDGHYRRYGKRELMERLSLGGFRVDSVRHVNFFSILPWYAYGRLTKKGDYPRFGNPGLINLLVRCMAAAERIIRPPIGLSMACVCSKGGKGGGG
jgi:SAM-dependent methyltransferase